MKSRDHGLVFIAEFIRVDLYAIVMSIHTRENAGTAWTTQRRGIESLYEGNALIENQCLCFGHKLHTVMTLVIGNDDDEIGAAAF